MRVGVVRIDREGCAKRLFRLLSSTLSEQEHAVVVVKIGLIAIEIERGLVVLGRQFVLTQTAMERDEVDVRLHGLGVYAQGFLLFLNGLVDLAGAFEVRAAT